MSEVMLGRYLGAVRAVAEVDRVQIALEDLLLGELLFDLDREHHLFELAVHGLVAGEQHVAHVLLRDRRATFDHLAGVDVVARGRVRSI